MRLVPEVSDKITVRIVVPERDPKTNRVSYTTFDSIDVTDAKPEEVFAVCKEAILRAGQPKKS